MFGNLFSFFGHVDIYKTIMTIQEKCNYIKEFVPSVWSGHSKFADWLMRYKNPSVMVDLGVDSGCSTFSFAVCGIGTVYGIDWFRGDPNTGYRDEKTKIEVMKHINVLDLFNVNIMHMSFDDALRDWTLPIDILHIDGYHAYDAVSHDYREWTKFLKPNGVVLLHDTCTEWLSVKEWFHEIQEPKLNFTNSYGLGVVSKDTVLLQDIRNNFASLMDSRY